MQDAGAQARLVDATNNKLTSLPDYVLSFTALQRLLLGSNQLTHLPEQIGALTQLRVRTRLQLFTNTPLVVQWTTNRTQTIRRDLLLLSRRSCPFREACCVRAARLQIAHGIEAVKWGLAFCASKMMKVTECNQARSVAAQALVLDDNRLTVLPDSIGQLARLERLSVGGNALAGLPASVGRLKKLVNLNVARNRMTTLPSALGDGSALEEFDASDNYLQVWTVPILSMVNQLHCCWVEGLSSCSIHACDHFCLIVRIYAQPENMLACTAVKYGCHM